MSWGICCKKPDKEQEVKWNLLKISEKKNPLSCSSLHYLCKGLCMNSIRLLEFFADNFLMHMIDELYGTIVSAFNHKP